MTTRIYIDTRERQNPDRTSDSDFVYALPFPINVTEGSKAIIESVAVPNTLSTILEGVNDLFVLIEQGQSGNTTIRELTLPPGYYSPFELAAVIATALNGGDRTIANGYGCTYVPDRSAFIMCCLLLLLPDEKLWILTYDWMSSHGDSYHSWVKRDAYRVTVFVNGPPIMATPQTMFAESPDMPQLQHTNQLFVKSNTFGSPSTSVGPSGAHNICRRVVIDSAHNEISVDRHFTTWGAISLNPGTLSSLDFRLCDYHGNIVDLNGHAWSMTIAMFKGT